MAATPANILPPANIALWWRSDLGAVIKGGRLHVADPSNPGRVLIGEPAENGWTFDGVYDARQRAAIGHTLARVFGV